MAEQTQFTVRGAADFLGVNIKTVRRWAQQNKMRGVKIGPRGDWRFSKADLLQMVKRPKGGE